MIPFFRVRSGEAPSMRNGRMVLEEFIKLFNGRVNPIRSFSLQELEKATDNFQKLGSWEIIIYPSLCTKEVAISSQMSAHKNVLELLGCCVETDTPILVFEFAENGTLEDHISCGQNSDRFRPLLWKERLKIAGEVASTVAYLHTAFPRPIVHRCLKASNIFLVDDYIAKLSDFSLAEPIPKGEPHIPDRYTQCSDRFVPLQGLMSNVFYEKSDVHCFGIILLVLLTGKKVAATIFGEYEMKAGVEEGVRNRDLRKRVDPRILEGMPWPGREQQLEAFAMLALRCTDTFDHERPTITDVAKEIATMYQLVP